IGVLFNQRQRTCNLGARARDAQKRAVCQREAVPAAGGSSNGRQPTHSSDNAPTGRQQRPMGKYGGWFVTRRDAQTQWRTMGWQGAAA
ncbi:hypothetical protein IWW55_005431, partial [Coemansia sp. RSA 2706]